MLLGKSDWHNLWLMDNGTVSMERYNVNIFVLTFFKTPEAFYEEFSVFLSMEYIYLNSDNKTFGKSFTVCFYKCFDPDGNNIQTFTSLKIKVWCYFSW